MSIIKEMICIDCSMRISSTIPKAKRAGWRVWVGGAKCKACVEQELGPREHVMPPTVAEAVTVLGGVRCSVCFRLFPRLQKYTDGYRPGIHWTPVTESERDPFTGRMPRPLCPGWNRAGALSAEGDCREYAIPAAREEG